MELISAISTGFSAASGAPGTLPVTGRLDGDRRLSGTGSNSYENFPENCMFRGLIKTSCHFSMSVEEEATYVTGIIIKRLRFVLPYACPTGPKSFFDGWALCHVIFLRF